MLKCDRVIFEQSSQLHGLSKAFVKRKTFKREAIFCRDQEGKLIYMFNSQTQAEKHVDEALRILQEIK